MDLLDGEILAVRAQIDALRQRRSLLSVSLLSSARTQTMLKRPQPAQSHNTSRQRQHAVDAAEAAAISVSASIIRASSGLTAFRASDPDPRAAGDGQVIGVRLDVYSRKQCCFDAPYFLIFRKTVDGHLTLHQHTIPAYVRMHILLRRYMSQRHDVGNEQVSNRTKQNLAAFVRGVRRELVAAAQRKDAITRLKDNVVAAQGRSDIIAVESMDPSSTNIQLQLRNDIVVRIQLGLCGTVHRLSVAAKDASGSRNKRLIERALSGFTDRIDQLPEKLRSMEM